MMGNSVQPDKLGEYSVLQLPTDFLHLATSTFNISKENFGFSIELRNRLEKFTLDHHVCLFTVLVSAYMMLLYRYTGQENLGISCSVTKRDYDGIEPRIAEMVLCTDVGQGLSFKEFIDKVHEVMVDELQGSRVQSKNLVSAQTSFSFEQAIRMPESESRINMSGLNEDSSKYDISLCVTEQLDGSLQGKIEYNTDLFLRSTVLRMINHFIVLIEAGVNQPDAEISDLDILNDEEKKMILVDWNSTKVDWKPTNVQEKFEEQVRRIPDAIAVEFEEQTITYEELNRRVNRLARYLRVKGVGPEVTVGIYLNRSIELIVGLLAIMKSGGAYVPLDPSYPIERINYILENAQISRLITTQDLASKVDQQWNGELFLLDTDDKEVNHQCTSNVPNGIKPNHLAYIIYTSGSTGTPKGVCIEHYSLVNLLLNLIEELELDQNDNIINLASHSFDMSVPELFLSICVGGKLIICPPTYLYDGISLKNIINEKEISVMQATPTTWNLLTETGWKAQSNRFRAICGAEPVSKALVNKLLLSCSSVWNFYGPTETTVWSTIARILDAERIHVGKPIGNTKVFILDNKRKPVPVGVIGEIYITGVGLAREYLRKEQLNNEKFIEVTLHGDISERAYKTGDLAKFLPNGQIQLLGRADYQIKLHGHRIELNEIEEVIFRKFQVSNALVQIIELSAVDKRLVAFVQPESKTQSLDSKGILAGLKTALPAYMVPSHVILLEHFPRLHNGKIDRNAMIDLFRKSMANLDKNEIHGSLSTYDLVERIWRNILGVSCSYDDNFFDIGGQSILALKVMSQLGEALGIALSVQLIFENPTINKLAARLRDIVIRYATRDMDYVRKSMKHGGHHQEKIYPASPAQKRMWALVNMTTNRLYNLSYKVEFKGEVHEAKLMTALERVFQSHEVFRVRFIMVNDELHYKISQEIETIQPARYVDSWDSHLVKESIQKQADGISMNHANQLFKVDLFKDHKHSYMMLFTVSHSIFDAQSLNVLLRDIIDCYSNDVNDELDSSSLFDMDVQEDASEEGLTYWVEQLKDAPFLLQIPTERPRKTIPTYNGAVETFDLSSELADRLRGFAREEHVTMFTVLVSAYKMLLYRYTGQEDIVLGCPVTERDSVELEQKIGLYVNTIVLRTNIRQTPTYRKLIGGVRNVVIDSLKNKSVPFDKVVNATKTARDLSYSPLFQTMFDFQQEVRMPDAAGLEINVSDIDLNTSKFDITLFMKEKADGSLKGKFEYSTDLFDRSTVLRMINHFIVLLQTGLDEPDKEIFRLNILTDEEKKMILVDWNDTKTGREPVNVQEMFEEQVKRTPDAIAVEFAEQAITYEELNQRVNRLARYLRDRGVSPEVSVGIYLNRSIELVVGLLAIIKSGGSYVPLDPSYPIERIHYILEHAQISRLIADQDLASRLDHWDGEFILVDTDMKEVHYQCASNVPNSIEPNHLAYIIYTSGSTGAPKGVCIEHRGLSNYLAWCVEAYNVKKYSQTYLFTPIGFDLTITSIFPPLLAGGRIVVLPQTDDIEMICKKIAGSEKQSLIKLTPAHLTIMINYITTMNCGHTYVVGGENLPPELVYELMGKSPHSIVFNEYGPTETVVGCAYLKMTNENIKSEMSVGRAISNTQIYILDPILNPVPIGVYGELYIGGVGVSRGYHKLDQRNKTSFIPDKFSTNDSSGVLFKTGDIAKFLPDGNIVVTGRMDHQVKIRGYRIELGEIQSVIMNDRNVLQAAVVVEGQSYTDKNIVVYLKIKNNDIRVLERIKKRVSNTLPRYMVPSRYIKVEHIPMTLNGKVDMAKLTETEPFNAIVESEKNVTSSLQLELLNIWSRVLKLQDVGIDDDFFEIGGDSFAAIAIINAIKERLGRDIPVSLLFNQRTIASLEKSLCNDYIKRRSAIVLMKEAQGIAPPFFLCHSGEGGILSYMNLMKTICNKFNVYGIEAPGYNLPDDKTLVSMKEFVDLYLEGILEICPEGPYYFAGWSLGGVFAHAIVAELERSGRDVSFLGLIDTPALTDISRPSDGYYQMMSNVWGVQYAYSLENLSDEKACAAMLNVLKREGKLPPSITDIDFMKRIEIIKRINNAAALYQPDRKIKSNVGYFSVKESEGNVNYWSKMTDGIFSCLEVPGTHFTIMSPPNVIHLANGIMEKALNACTGGKGIL